MPGKDGKGPAGNSKGRRMGEPAGTGPGGMCVCPSCGAQVKHTMGTPCNSTKCPQCGSLMMVRQ